MSSPRFAFLSRSRREAAVSLWSLLLGALFVFALPVRASDAPTKPSLKNDSPKSLGYGEKAPTIAIDEKTLALDRAIDWTEPGLIAVQEGNRYKTLESWSREAMSAMTGRERLGELSPIASLFEWLFNRERYLDTPLVRIKERGLQMHFSAHFPEEQRRRIQSTGRMTPRELADATVQRRMEELEPRFDTASAMGRVRKAEAICEFLPRLTRVVPGPSSDPKALWLAPDDLRSNASFAFIDIKNPDRAELERIVQQFGMPIQGIKPETAVAIYGAWTQLGDAWRAADAPAVQGALTRLSELLPANAAAGVYPSHSQRAAEARYYRFGKFTWAYLVYLTGAIVSVLALATGWRWPWWLAVMLLATALGIHGYGIALRWFILGRIPIANMFEAIFSAAWMAVALGLILELVFRSRILLVASTVTGFVSVVVATFAVPGGADITSIMGILDDIMLRIHTVVITFSYVLVFLAGVIGLVYLLAYYARTAPRPAIELSTMVALAGGLLLVATNQWMLGGGLYDFSFAVTALKPGASFALAIIAGLAVLVMMAAIAFAAPLMVSSIAATCLLVFGSIAWLRHDFAVTVGWSLLVGGAAWSMLTGVTRLALAPRLALAGAGGGALPTMERPIMAGGAPGDERSVEDLPAWMLNIDWMHLVVLNQVFILLFIGTILGAVWADYSWGRPWGWDPKEVFAMNTWLVYAILIHVRFVVKQRGLWTAWLSVIGCAMMAFNWWAVNHYITGIHSYA